MILATKSEERELRVGVHRITKAIKATLGDDDHAVEHGAYAVALVMAASQLGMQFVHRSYKGPGFDFYIMPPDTASSDPDDIFDGSWGFEVSGILMGDERAIQRRLRQKRNQVAEATRLLPVLIAVVEFSRPVARFQLLVLDP